MHFQPFISNLFNIYSEKNISRSIDAVEEIKINGEIINNIRYADDIVILASSLQKLQHLENINRASEEYGLSL